MALCAPKQDFILTAVKIPQCWNIITQITNYHSTRIKKKKVNMQTLYLTFLGLFWYSTSCLKCAYTNIRFLFFIMKTFAWYWHKYLSILRKISVPLSFAVMMYYLLNFNAKWLFKFKKMNLRILSLDRANIFDFLLLLLGRTDSFLQVGLNTTYGYTSNFINNKWTESCTGKWNSISQNTAGDVKSSR